jgi:nitroreductase
MEFNDLVYLRHSVREFSDKPVPEDTLKQIITIAGRSPSWENSQPWKAYIATGLTLNKIKETWNEYTLKKIKGNPDMKTQHRVEFSQQSQENMAQFNEQLIKWTKDPELSEFIKGQGNLFKASAVVYLTLPKNASQWSVYDLGSFGQTLQLAAKNLGVDSIPAYAYVMYPDVIRKYMMSIKDDEMLSVGIGLGYATEHILNSFQTERLPIARYLTIYR